MRLWSLHPQYLDTKGLTATWREGLLAQAVLHGETKGYQHHPQLIRFRQHPDPLGAIAAYLQVVAEEAARRGYHFQVEKIIAEPSYEAIPVSRGQLEYERQHLRAKLEQRDPQRLPMLLHGDIQPHPLFVVVEGDVADWERQAVG